MSNGAHFINGEWIAGRGEPLAWSGPLDGETIWHGHCATADEVDRAVRAARQAAAHWAVSFDERAQYLQRFAQLVTAHTEELTEAICLDTGKPRWESRTEVDAMAAKVPLSIQAYQQRRAEFAQQTAAVTAVTRYKPHGVVAVLGPFNLPGHLPNGHIVPALLAGNTVVFKPSEMAPRVGELVMRLWQAADLPPGTINMVQGARQTGQLLATHRGLEGLFFTGSFAAGQSLNRALAAQPGKILALEMGGNNPLVVHQVQDTKAAAYTIIQSAFITAGQRCSCARRLVVIDGPECSAITDALVSMMQTIRVGPYTQTPEPFMGPVISSAAASALLEAQDKLLRSGARALFPMKLLAGSAATLSPGLIDVTDVADRPDEELFGPLLQLIRAKDFDAAIREANNTRYGLAAGLLSDRRDLYDRFFGQIRAGIVNWNRPTTGASSALPFGGVGYSGNHRPSGYWAADYCSYPVASLESPTLALPPTQATPGVAL